jgi:Zn-dependent peptidase ImmA (M78 family)
MGEDESEQPLTEHLVDQFASYFLITMVAFHLVGYMKKQYEKRHSDKYKTLPVSDD